MDDKRKGEIAYALLRHRISKEGVPLRRNELRRHLGYLAKAIGVGEEEVAAFAEMLVRDLVETAFRK